MDESRKHKVEGLLQARADDLTRPRRRRPARRPVEDTSNAARVPGPELATPAAGRACETCGEPIDARRVRAMPSAGRCLPCQRAHELAEARS